MTQEDELFVPELAVSKYSSTTFQALLAEGFFLYGPIGAQAWAKGDPIHRRNGKEWDRRATRTL